MRQKLRNSRYGEWMNANFRPKTTIDLPELQLSLPIDDGDIVIDCGANVGDITSRFARTRATIHAFEPNPVCNAILRERFALIGRVHLYEKGVMDRAVTLRFETPKPDGEYDAVRASVGGSFMYGEDDADSRDANTIDCIDFSAFVASLGKRIKLVKMDIEGAEVAVINHMIDTGVMDKVDFMIVETHERMSDELAEGTARLRERLVAEGIADRIRLDWI